MSNGNPRVTIRLPKDLLAQVKEAVERRNANGISPESWDVSQYVQRAIEDKLKHDRRSNRKRNPAGKRIESAMEEIDRAFDDMEAVMEQLARDNPLPPMPDCPHSFETQESDVWGIVSKCVLCGQLEIVPEQKTP